jgi:hypothetical protein
VFAGGGKGPVTLFSVLSKNGERERAHRRGLRVATRERVLGG